MEEKIGFLNRILKINVIRDLNYIISGFFILIIVNYFFKPSLDSYPNIQYFGAVGRYIGFSILAYFTARGFNEIGGLIVHIFYFLVSKSQKYDLKQLIIFVDSICDIKVKENEALNLKQNVILHAEVIQYLYDKPEIHSLYERYAQKLMYETIFVGFTFFILFFINHVLVTFLLFLVILFRTVKTKFKFAQFHNDITVLLAREKQDRAPF